MLRRIGKILGSLGVLALVVTRSTPAHGGSPSASARSSRSSASIPMDRRFLIGLEGVALQVPGLRPHVVTIDPRRVSNAVALGGVGLLGRLRVVDTVAFELGVRSGSLRYKARDSDDAVAQDLVLFSAAVLLYLVRGELGHLALDGGIGGIYNRVGYDLDDHERAVQHYPSGHVQVGIDAELLLKRVALVISLRSYGVWTPSDQVRNQGRLLREAPALDRRAPVPPLQTYVAATAGLAYRF